MAACYPDIHCCKGLALFKMGRVEEALASFGEALHILPDYARAKYYSAVCLYFLGREQEARQALSGALSIATDIEKEMGLAGHLMLGLGDYDDAVEVLERRDFGAAPSASVYSTLGVAYLRKSNTERARDLFLKSVKLEPGNTEALIHLGEISRTDGDVDTAIDYLKQARDASPGFADVRCRLGEAYLSKEDIKEAIEEFNEAIKINANFIDARIALSFALRRLGREDEALQQVDEVLAIDPHNVVALAEKQSFVLDRPSTGKQSVET
jgi:tetratricopeptide (TPR) repeat protein